METTKTQKSAVDALVSMYDWHTKLYNNSLAGLTDKDAQNRLNTKANHIAWIAGSLVQARYEVAGFLNIEMKQTSDELFEDHKGIQDDVAYPSLEEYKKDWDAITPKLREALVNVTEEQLNSPDPWNMPGGPYTFFDTLLGCIDRESYCIGQVGLWRRLLGYEAMKYE